jgi:hypothetical protein
MAIIDQVTLRAGVADWLNRSDLTDAQIDDFISIGEARIYETLRVPTLEISQGFAVTTTNSSIIVPEGFLEMIELKVDASGKDNDIALSRVDSKTFINNKISYAYTRHIGNFLLTDSAGEQKAGGNYIMYYYKAEDPIGTYSSTATAATALVAGKYYTIATVGTTNFNSYTDGDTHANTAGVIFKASGAGSGTGTAYEEVVPYILSDVFEVILYAACTAASVYLGDIEMEQKFDVLTEGKVNALNQKEIRASMKGAAFASQFSTPLL